MANPENAREIGFSAEFRLAIAELSNARKAEKEATDRKKRAEAVVKEILGEHTSLTIGGSPAVIVVPASTTSIDREMLKEFLDKATIELVTKTTNYTKLTVLDTSNI